MDRKEYQKKYKEEYKNKKKQICLSLKNKEFLFAKKEADKLKISVNQFLAQNAIKILNKMEGKKDEINELSLKLSKLKDGVQETAQNINKMAHICNSTKGANFNENDLLIGLKKLSDIVLDYTQS